MFCSVPSDFSIFPKEFRWQFGLICFRCDPLFSFSFRILISTLFVTCISRRFWSSELSKGGVLSSTCLSVGPTQNEASGGLWERCFFWDLLCDEVDRHQDLVAACHQDRAEIGQLEWPRPEMARMMEDDQGVCGDILCGTVPSGSTIEESH